MSALGSSLFAAVLDRDPRGLRRLGLLLYAMVGPLFMAILLVGADPPVPVAPILAIAGLILAGAAVMALRPGLRGAGWIFPGAVSPIACCGIAYWICGDAGSAFLVILGAPIAWAGVLFEPSVVIAAWSTAILTGFTVVALAHGLLAALLNTLLLAGVLGLVAWVVSGVAEGLRRAKAELARDAVRLAGLLTVIPDTVARLDREGRFLDVHLPPNDVLPRPRERLIGRSVYDLLPAPFVPATRAAVERALAAGEVSTIDYELEYPGGTLAFEARIARTGDDEVAVVRRDVTAQRAQARAHAELERSWRLALRGGGLGVWDVHVPSGRVFLSDWHGGATTATPSRRLESDVDRWIARVHPEHRQTVELALDRCRSGEAAHFEQEYRIRSRTGAWVWVYSRGEVVERTADGAPLRLVGVQRSITAQKEAEEALRAAGGFRQAVIDALADRVAVIDSGGRVVDANAAWREAEAALPAARISEHGSDGSVLAASLVESVRATLSGAAHEVEREVGPTDDGTWLGVRVTRMAGEPAHAVAAVADITARKRAELALRESEARFRAMADAAPVLIWTAATDTRCDYFNRPWLEFTGRTLEQELGDGWAEGVHPEDLQRCLDVYLGSFEARRPFVMEYRLRHADGTWRWILEHGAPRTSPEGAFDGYIGSCTDITRLKETEATLRQSEERFRKLMAISGDGIHVLDVDGTLVEANEAFLEMLGQDASVIGSLNVYDWDVTMTPEELLSAIRRIMDEPALFQTRHRRRDGRILDVEIQASGVELVGRRYLLASSRDITARKEFERALAAKQAELEELNRSLEVRVKEAVGELRAKDRILATQSRHAAMGEMVGNIAHQWRQPLNALGLVLSNLRDAWRYGELDEASLEAEVATGMRLVLSMSATINDFRDFFRPKKEKEPFSPLAQVRAAVALVGASFEHAGISVEVEASADPMIRGFANEYAQVLLNLLSNAKQAIEGSRRQAGRVVIHVGVEGRLGVLTLRDDGGGIREDIFDRLFEPYFSTKEGGTGIGLYMSRQIIERGMGGRIEVRNVEGGAELRVLVPLAGAAT